MRTPSSVRRTLVAALGLGLAASLGLASTGANAGDSHMNGDSYEQVSKTLRKHVLPSGIIAHTNKFGRIAKLRGSGGSRAAGTLGYERSSNYVVNVLRDAGYEPEIQTFDFQYYRELGPGKLERVSPDPKSYARTADYIPLQYSPPGDVTGQVVPVDTDVTPRDTSTSACEAEDFVGFPSGAIALVQRGTCSFAQKVANAADAGAAAVILFNRGTAGATAPVLGTLSAPARIPAVFSSFDAAVELSASADTIANVVTDTSTGLRSTWNVIAETSGGNADNTVMVGAHLDSVDDGPGTNDNGSGSATILEIARQLDQEKVNNKVRFAWWGAEEFGLIGSRFYVNTLPAEARAQIKMYLNFDMVGSPNYARFVYDGDNSSFPVGVGSAAGPAGSGDIEKTFSDYFASKGLASAPTEFSGRSDYGPFIAVGIPAGGLFTGAEGIKTENEAALFGGEAGVAYDTCYHKACDGLTNVNVQAIDEMSDAAADAVAKYSVSIDSLTATAPLKIGGRKLSKAVAKRRGLHDHQHEYKRR